MPLLGAWVPTWLLLLASYPTWHGSFFTALVVDVLFCQPSICFSEDCCTRTCFSDVLIGAGELCVFLLCHLNLLPSPLPFTRQEPDAWETGKTPPPRLTPAEPSFVEVQWWDAVLSEEAPSWIICHFSPKKTKDTVVLQLKLLYVTGFCIVCPSWQSFSVRTAKSLQLQQEACCHREGDRQEPLVVSLWECLQVATAS